MCHQLTTLHGNYVVCESYRLLEVMYYGDDCFVLVFAEVSHESEQVMLIAQIQKGCGLI